MSEHLKNFYHAYWQWLNDGALEGGAFSRRVGLCNNMERYLLSVDYPGNPYMVVVEMQDQFKRAGLDTVYPFGESAFEQGLKERTQHLNPYRNAWVEEHLQ